MNKILMVLALSLTGCQSGCSSRLGGSAVELPLPKDFKTPVGFGRTGDGKHLMYISTENELKVKEYSDMGILEAEYIFK